MIDSIPPSPFARRQQQWQQLQNNRQLLAWGWMLLCGLIVACGLTWFMHYLIQSTHQELDHAKRIRLLEFVRVKREEVSERKNVKPERPDVQQTPETPDMPDPSNDMSSDSSLSVSMSAPLPSDSFNLSAGGYGLEMNDGDYLPIVKIAPIYPAKATRMGLEGNCVVRYTVTTQGTVRDPVVVEDMCDHPIFHRVSIEAALKFRYKPRVIDGEPVEVPNVMNRFIFEMER